jgi:hypothetical protein
MAGREGLGIDFVDLTNFRTSPVSPSGPDFLVEVGSTHPSRSIPNQPPHLTCRSNSRVVQSFAFAGVAGVAPGLA